LEVTVTDSEITTTILREIRDEIIGLRSDQNQLRIELKAEMSGLRAELRAELGELNHKVEALGRYAKNVTRRVERAIEELRERVAKLEARRKN
jgi:hypothetical protein